MVRDLPDGDCAAALRALTDAVRRYKAARQVGLGTRLAQLRVAVADIELRELLAAAAVDLQSSTRATHLELVAEAGPAFEQVAPGLSLLI